MSLNEDNRGVKPEGGRGLWIGRSGARNTDQRSSRVEQPKKRRRRRVRKPLGHVCGPDVLPVLHGGKARRRKPHRRQLEEKLGERANALPGVGREGVARNGIVHREAPRREPPQRREVATQRRASRRGRARARARRSPASSAPGRRPRRPSRRGARARARHRARPTRRPPRPAGPARRGAGPRRACAEKAGGTWSKEPTSERERRGQRLGRRTSTGRGPAERLAREVVGGGGEAQPHGGAVLLLAAREEAREPGGPADADRQDAGGEGVEGAGVPDAPRRRAPGARGRRRRARWARPACRRRGRRPRRATRSRRPSSSPGVGRLLARRVLLRGAAPPGRSRRAPCRSGSRARACGGCAAAGRARAARSRPRCCRAGEALLALRLVAEDAHVHAARSRRSWASSTRVTVTKPRRGSLSSEAIMRATSSRISSASRSGRRPITGTPSAGPPAGCRAPSPPRPPPRRASTRGARGRC